MFTNLKCYWNKNSTLGGKKISPFLNLIVKCCAVWKLVFNSELLRCWSDLQCKRSQPGENCNRSDFQKKCSFLLSSALLTVCWSCSIYFPLSAYFAQPGPLFVSSVNHPTQSSHWTSHNTPNTSSLIFASFSTEQISASQLYKCRLTLQFKGAAFQFHVCLMENN